MSKETLTNRFDQAVKAAPEQVYFAFTNATTLREWLCDIATVLPRLGGRVYLGWNSGYYSAGEYAALEPGKCVDFTWRGRGEPGETQVKVTLEGQGDGTLVRLEHTGFGPGAEWQTAIQESKEGWPPALENLASILETGQDLRITRRPMMGIMMSDFNAEIAGQLGIPVVEGVRVDGTLEGMGARKAGLVQDDLLVAMDGKPVVTYSSLGTILQKHMAGDVIEVEFYRGPEKMKANLPLSGRPLPDIPFDPKELAARLKTIYAELEGEMAQIFEGATDAEANLPPAPDQWCALEVVAHLLQGERYTFAGLVNLIGGHERWSDDYGPNLLQETRAVVAAYPTIAEMLAEHRRSHTQLLALVETFPPEFVERKGSYWRYAYGLLESGAHDRGHYDQIRAALQAGKQK